MSITYHDDNQIVELHIFYNAELHALYSSPNIISNRKSRQPRWAGYVACMEQSIVSESLGLMYERKVRF